MRDEASGTGAGPRHPLGLKGETQRELRRAVSRAVALIEARLDEPPSTAELAKVAGVSEAHFHRAFAVVVGETVARHGARLRLERAASHLKFSNWHVQDIATAAGFATQASFTRAFRRLYGMSPLAFRSAQEVKPFLRERWRARSVRMPQERRGPMPTVRIEDWPALELVCLRAYLPLRRLDEPWAELLEWYLGAFDPADGARFFGVWFDDWLRGDEPVYRYEAAVAPAARLDAPPPAPFTVRVLPAGAVAVTQATGGRRGIEDAWRAFGHEWLPLSGYQFRVDLALDEYPASNILKSTKTPGGTSSPDAPVRLCLPVTK